MPKDKGVVEMPQGKKLIKLQQKAGIRYELTANKKQAFYSKDLSPLKNNIMKIFLINPEVAADLMKLYNQLVDGIDENGEISTKDMKNLIDLEKQVEEAEKKLERGNIETFYSQCERLLKELTPERIQITEEEWKKLKQILEERTGDLTLQERSQVENILSELRFYIIREKIKQDASQTNLKEEIPEEEASELENAFLFSIDTAVK